MKPIRIPIAGPEMARVRFAVSPLYEAFAAVDTLWEPGSHAVQLPWVRWARPLLAQIPDVALVGTFMGTPRKPGFLCPVPDVRMPGVEDELARIRAADPARVRRFFDNREEQPMGRFHRELYDDPVGGLARLAEALRQVHDTLIAPHWSRMLGVLEADIAYRAGILADGGVEAVFDGLHADVRWTGGVLHAYDPEVRQPPVRTKEVVLDGRALVLSPSVFVWPDICVSMNPVNAGILRYPARGLATVWETRKPAPDTLAALLGKTRADLLAGLGEPATTADLATRLGVTAGAVSQHLGVLRGAGLVATRREGRAVLHLRTERAETLLR